MVAQLHFEVGSSFLNQDEFNKAVDSFIKSVSYKKTAEGYFNLAQSYEGIEDFESAKKSYGKAIILDDTFEMAYFNLGVVQFNSGDLNAAIVSFRKVIESDSADKEALMYLANLYLLRQDFGSAEKYVNRLLEIDPRNVEARELLNKLP